MRLTEAQKRFLWRCAKFKSLDLIHESGTCFLKAVVAHSLWKKGILEKLQTGYNHYKLTESGKQLATEVLFNLKK